MIFGFKRKVITIFKPDGVVNYRVGVKPSNFVKEEGEKEGKLVECDYSTVKIKVFGKTSTVYFSNGEYNNFRGFLSISS